jgi:CheY-like chemotaxis protein
VALVLLVEDHRDTRLMYSEFLTMDGFEVVQAADGEEALTLMAARTPDLVITDLALPRVDGFELMRRMRNDPTLAAVPVICLSGYSDDSREQRARAAGCSRLIQKPCLPDTLAEAASALLRSEPQRDRVR